MADDDGPASSEFALVLQLSFIRLDCTARFSCVALGPRGDLLDCERIDKALFCWFRSVVLTLPPDEYPESIVRTGGRWLALLLGFCIADALEAGEEVIEAIESD